MLIPWLWTGKTPEAHGCDSGTVLLWNNGFLEWDDLTLFLSLGDAAMLGATRWWLSRVLAPHCPLHLKPCFCVLQWKDIRTRGTLIYRSVSTMCRLHFRERQKQPKGRNMNKNSILTLLILQPVTYWKWWDTHHSAVLQACLFTLVFHAGNYFALPCARYSWSSS
jgi:hypothetical protein